MSGVMALYGHGAAASRRRIGFDISPQSAAAGRTATSPARWASRRWTGSASAGAGAHTLEEHMLVDSLVPRAKLMAGLLQVV